MEHIHLDVSQVSTETLRDFKKAIEAELSKRHKAKENEKCNCWTCHHCFYDDEAHISHKKGNRGGYRCMAWSKRGKIISTKHKAPVWCPLGERPYYYYGKRKEKTNER